MHLLVESKQHDKADFQQLVLDQWKISPTITITGKQGIVLKPQFKHFRDKYKLRTLESWAREVAPEEVKNRRGRRPKLRETTKS